MLLAKRIEVLKGLKDWWALNDQEWQDTKQRAYLYNQWFIPEFLDHRIHCITNQYLDEEKLDYWTRHYHLDDNVSPRNIGIVMAGNIPLVGFHDFLAVFVSGHKAVIKLSEKDDVLMRKVVDKMIALDPDVKEYILFAEMLKGCDAYIATGSNNTSRYFDYYFGKYPSIIRKNRAAAAVLTGAESHDELALLADDVFLYFGLGCRNVSQIYVPEGYDFVPLLDAFRKYEYLKDHAKYRNNYDYNLALLIMNSRAYMCNENIILVEGDQLFSPISELYFSYYKDAGASADALLNNEQVQCVAGKGYIPMGQTQQAGLFDYADGVDVMEFLLSV